MPSPPDALPRQVVLTPDLVGRALCEVDAAAVLRLWRDGRIQPVLNRDLLVRYLRLLRRLGLSESMVKRWAWWFSDPRRVRWTVVAAPPGSGAIETCEALAVAHAPCVVVHGPAAVPPAGTSNWFGIDRMLALDGSEEGVR